MKIVAFFGGIFIALMIIIHTNKTHADKFVYFHTGKQSELTNINKPRILNTIKELVQNVNDVWRIEITPDYINDLKKSQQGLEITLEQDFDLQVFEQNISVNKILLPLCETESTNCKNGTIFLGAHNEYWTPPYLNTSGARLLNEIKEMIKIKELQ